MIELRNTTKRYGKNAALDNISLCLKENKIYCLLGSNGAGKTTMMNLISGRFAPTNGEISVNGIRVTTLNMPENVRH